jgi:hypothetical protein
MERTVEKDSGKPGRMHAGEESALSLYLILYA